MLSVSYLFEGTPKGYVEKGATNVAGINQAYFKKMFATSDPIKREKLMKAHMKLQARVHRIPSSFT